MGIAVLDASVLIAQTDASDAHHARARTALLEAERRGELVAPATTFAEVMTGAYMAGPREVETLSRFFETVVRVVPFTVEIAMTAARLRAQGRLKLADAAVIATGIELDADVILTADRRWRKIDPRVQVV
jgi:predicted nucleic acid-binding protein